MIAFLKSITCSLFAGVADKDVHLGKWTSPIGLDPNSGTSKMMEINLELRINTVTFNQSTIIESIYTSCHLGKLN